MLSKIEHNVMRHRLNARPKLFDIFCDVIDIRKKQRIFIGFLLGLFISIILYKGVITDLQLERYISLTLGVIIVAMLSIGCASSIQIRCICLLTIPAFFGRAGRSVLRALVLGYLIAGPIFNLTYNAKEIVRTFACTTELTYNLTKTRFDLMFKPFQEAIMAMKDGENELKNTLVPIKDLISPIVEEIEGEDEMRHMNEENDYLDELQEKSNRIDKRDKTDEEEMRAKSEAATYEINYKRKVESRCAEQLNRGVERCRDMFGDAYTKCYDKVSGLVAWLLCWPMKLTFVCNLVQALGSSNICNSKGKVNTEIGEGYKSLKSLKSKYSQSVKEAKLQYKVKKIPLALDVHDAMDAAGTVMHEFNMRKRFIETVITVIKRCLSFIFLKIIISSQNYHDKYLTEINYDNTYITSYFRKIDARRKANGSLTLLPLRKLEKHKFIDPSSLKLSKSERPYVMGQMVKLIVEVITATTFILLDRLFYEILDLIRRHTYMEYTQAGSHDIVLDVHGTGVIASLLKRVMQRFNIKKRVKTVVSNAACLPQPSKLPNYVIIKIYSIYIVVFLLLFTAVYTQRVRRTICAFFYRKREKRRILYLYNETLRRRLGYVKFIRTKVKALAKIHHLGYDFRPWMEFRLRSPTLCNWLSFFACARAKCFVCDEVEPRKGSKFHRCITNDCVLTYCPECWKDVGEVCFGCTDLSDSGSEEYNM